MTRSIAVLPAALLALGLQQPSQPPTFHAETRLIVLQATVRDAHGALVGDLDKDAFTVYENGTRQSITLFRRDDVPVSIGLVIDNSGSMRAIRPRVEAAAVAFARASNPLDEMFVVNFADTVRVDVPMTSDVGVLAHGVERVDAIGGTALYDAIKTAEGYLAAHAARDRRALVVITDGNDNASEATAAEIARQAESRDTVIYALGLFEDDPARVKRGHHELDQLTTRTGGLVHYPAAPDQIEALAVQLAHEIRSQYTIAYAPTNQSLDGKYRSIRVDVSGHGHLTVHTRPGYRAGGGAPPTTPGR
jgi:Ca-activated chloride channel homolog